MDAKQLSAANLNDIVFENRNKAYGAYELRNTYSRHVNTALAIAVALLVFLLLAPSIYKLIKPEEVVVDAPEKIVTINELDAPPPMDETKPPPPPVDVPPPPKEIIKFVPPKVVKEEVTEEPPPPIEEIKEKTTSDVSQEGDVTFEYVPPKEKVVIEEKPKEEEILEFADQQPEFPGGEGAYQKYLIEHINYPAFAVDNNIQGTVYLKAVIGTDGKVGEVKVLKGVSGLTDEALRVVKDMPGWKPGKQNGRPVKVWVTLPIKFVLKQ